MKSLYQYLSFASLALMLAASVLLFLDLLERSTYQQLALIGTVGWFATVPFWMKRRLGEH